MRFFETFLNLSLLNLCDSDNMPKAHSPRKGSLAFRPRKRAETLNSRIRNWPEYTKPSLLGFVGYKAGMVHFLYLEDSQNSPNKGKEVASAGTVIEVPPVHAFAIRVYKDTPVGKRVIGDFMPSAEEDPVVKKAGLKGKPLSELDKVAEEISDLRVLVLTNPGLTTIGKKKQEVVELGVGGKDVKEKLEFAKSIIGKDVNVEDVFEPGTYIDVIGVTKGKGWQGVIKRFGIAKQRRKATGRYRHLGNLGAWHPAVVEYTVAQAGQMGFHKRTILNNLLVQIGDAKDLNQKGGLLHYGEVRTKYVIVKGSIPGPKKRLIKLRRALRRPEDKRPLKVTYVSPAK